MKIVFLAYKNWRLLANLIKSDFKNRYLGNHLGIIWAFVQPLVMIAVYWFVFTFGFRNRPIENAPFLLWLLVGLVPWFFINDAISSSSRAIIDQAFLVKKIVFEVKLLPLVKIGSALLVSLVFWLFLLIYLISIGFYPSWLWLEAIYFLFCAIAFVLGFSLLLSAITVFVLDTNQFIIIFLQIMFWVTPVFWDVGLLPHRYVWVIKFNPFAYIVNGLRDALIYHRPFWVHYNVTLYFWVLTILLFVVGNRVFNNLRPHFADVL